jgi:hypothetical protein
MTIGRRWWSPLLLAAGCGTGAGGSPTGTSPAPARLAVDEAVVDELVEALVARHGAAQSERARRGVRQVLDRWQADDGDPAELRTFVEEQFLADPRALTETFERLEHALLMLDGHAQEADRELGRFQDLDEGPSRPLDGLLAAYGPAAHINEDLFRSGPAFVALLNWPIRTLEESVTEGRGWSRREWAEARLAQRFEHRLPAEVLQEIGRAGAEAGAYIDAYNVRMDRLWSDGAAAGFPDGLRLISHWGLRDEIRAQYGRPDGTPRQRLIARVMERIVRQELPQEALDSADWEWDPGTNLVRPVGETAWREGTREADERYAQLLAVFRARAAADPYFPSLPTHIDRSFARDRELPEARVRELLESILLSPTAVEAGKRIAARLGRPLEPFDLWYTGFRPNATLDEAELDRRTRERYPDVAAFQADLPRILGQLGFDAETAAFLAAHIVVEPSRGPGEAVGAQLREAAARLRTRFGPGGMDYKGYNIAIHELGHTVEQVFSISRIDHPLLQGVPNTGFTEAFAFLFQVRDLQLLGAADPGGEEARHLRALDRFWDAYEIAGVALLDLAIWHWMYDHPQATPAELREAMVEQARAVWNRYYAPVFGSPDAVLPAIYSHIIAYALYTPDYPLGMIISSQVEEYLRTHELAPEMERMCRLGRLAPDVWMTEAVGGPVSADPLLRAAAEALAALPE